MGIDVALQQEADKLTMGEEEAEGPNAILLGHPLDAGVTLRTQAAQVVGVGPELAQLPHPERVHQRHDVVDLRGGLDPVQLERIGADRMPGELTVPRELPRPGGAKPRHGSEFRVGVSLEVIRPVPTVPLKLRQAVLLKFLRHNDQVDWVAPGRPRSPGGAARPGASSCDERTGRIPPP